MGEDFIRIGPMLILAGLLAGWIAEATTRAGGYGFISDMVLGLAGGVVIGGAIRIFVSGEAGMATMFVIGCAGAALAIAAQRTLWRSFRPGT